jgi:CheY-like chemotaxis protein
MAKILVVDDDKETVETICAGLEGLGHEAEGLSDGKATLARVREMQPDLLILDYKMPVLSGTRIVSALRADGRTRRLPVILLSARDPILYAGEVPPEPRVRFLLKPISLAILDTMIAEMLNPDGWSA